MHEKPLLSGCSLQMLCRHLGENLECLRGRQVSYCYTCVAKILKSVPWTMCPPGEVSTRLTGQSSENIATMFPYLLLIPHAARYPYIVTLLICSNSKSPSLPFVVTVNRTPSNRGRTPLTSTPVTAVHTPASYSSWETHREDNERRRRSMFVPRAQKQNQVVEVNVYISTGYRLPVALSWHSRQSTVFASVPSVPSPVRNNYIYVMYTQ